MKKKILVTGCAGFIGFHLCKSLFGKEYQIIGIDNLNNYYDVNLKLARLNNLMAQPNFKFYKIDIKNKIQIDELFGEYEFDLVINLAAQAGVRYSIQNPYSYLENNVTGFVNILESMKMKNLKKLIYASSSSVYGANKSIPFCENHCVETPLSIYAATKKANELLAHSYSSMYGIKTIGLRFFTVYGEWGRPDMAAFLFTKNMLEGKPINLFNKGNLKRDFTFVDDIVNGIKGIIKKILFSSNGNVEENYKIFNIGNNQPVELKRFVNILEDELHTKALINYLPMQDGDVYETFADIESLNKYIGYVPQTSIDIGLHKFVKWYKDFYVNPISTKNRIIKKQSFNFSKII